ncbi:MAG: putative toxin-antitoxin system toxin component, PIN family [Ignavibacteriales bacterium]|nr:putative toxin-antitoxin system toxin component, PIN family [Ignavibacteriales bacterium]
MKYVAVFDTNILVSASGWKGKPFRCVELSRAGVVESVTCSEILDEARRILRTKLEFPDDEVLDIITDYLTFFRLVTIHGTLPQLSSDPSDTKILECAVEAKATHIVTGDTKHLLPLKEFQGISIVSADDFLSLVLQEKK